MQEDIVLSVVNNQDTIALLPTGGGKSICFQVPGLALGGTTLVVSPLVALMNDQVDNLKKRGVSAVAISAAMNKKQIQLALNNAAMGHVQFLYVSPERLQNEVFRQQLGDLPITLVAVDEAHCISQWGYDFRPSYLKIAELRKYFNEVKIIAVTASATTEVVKDIADKLELHKPAVFRQSFTRANLRYVVQLEENKLERLQKLILNIGGSGVVYLRNRRKTEELAKILKSLKISAAAYHAGLSYDDRKNIQTEWIENKVQVICATNAFGMGIDKPDVRFVAHLDLPDSLEAYFQEAGRGGRDGKTAYAALFFNKRDEEKLLENFDYAFPDPEQIKQVYKAIGNYYQIAIGAGEGLSMDFDIELLCRSYGLHPVTVYNSIKFLEKENYLAFFEAGSEPSKMMFICDKEYLYDYQLKNPALEPLIKVILRTYGGVFDNYVFINEKDLMYKVKLNLNELVKQLKLLNTFHVASYIPQSSLPKIIYTNNRIHDKEITFDPVNYKNLKENYRKRIHSVIDYANNNKVCRQIQLLNYFNEYTGTSCGYCDVCLANKPKNFDKIKKQILEILKSEVLSLEELKTRMKRYNDDTWVQAFNELVEEGQITTDNSKFLVR